MYVRKVIEGERINNFTVIRREYKKDGYWWFLCKCDCGKEFCTSVNWLRKRKSCGCKNWETLSKSKKTHGESTTKLYHVWVAMKKRCYSKSCPDYPNYGGRGIKVCPEWLNDYLAFRDWAYANNFKELSQKGRCSVDRIDMNGNYEPSNCRLADDITQANNRRSNIHITYNGETHTVAEWARIKGLDRRIVSDRLKKGWSIEDAINKPKVYDKERSLSTILDMLKNKEKITYDELTKVCTRTLALRYIKELVSRGHKIIHEKELSNQDGQLKWRTIYRLEDNNADTERNDTELH